MALDVCFVVAGIDPSSVYVHSFPSSVLSVLFCCVHCRVYLSVASIHPLSDTLVLINVAFDCAMICSVCPSDSMCVRTIWLRESLRYVTSSLSERCVVNLC